MKYTPEQVASGEGIFLGWPVLVAGILNGIIAGYLTVVIWKRSISRLF